MTKKNEVGRREFLKDMTLAGAMAAVVPARPSSLPGMSQGGLLQANQGGDWVRFGHDLHNTRFNSVEGQLGKSNVGRLWQKWHFETAAPIQTTPTVVGDTLFFGTMAGDQYALEAATGKEKWRFFAGYNPEPGAGNQGVRSSAQYEDGKLYFGTGLAKVHCLDAATGEEIWQVQLDDDPMGNRAQIFCSVAVHRGRVYVGTSSSQAQAVCLDAETGRIRWRFYVVEKSREGGGSIWTSPAIDETANIVYFVTGSLKSYLQPDPMLFSESMLAFDADTGEMLWHDQVRAADTFDLDFSCHPMIFDAVHPAQKNEVRKCVGAASKAGFYCFNRYTGQRYWKAMLTSSGPSSGPILNSTAVAYNRIFVVSNAAPVRGRSAMSVTAALHAYTGDIMWWIANPAHVRGPVAVANGVFYQGFDDGTLEAIDVNSGERLFTRKLPGLIRGGMAISNGTLYTSTGDTLGWRPGGDKKYGVYAFSPDGQ